MAIVIATASVPVRTPWRRGEGRCRTQARLCRRVRRGRPLRARGRRSTASSAPRRSWRDARSATPGRAAAGRHRLVRPRPPGPGDQDRAARRLERGRATASTASRRRPARCSPAGSPSSADRRVYLRALRRGRRPVLATCVGQIERALPTEPDVAVILIGVNDVTHTRAAVASRCATCPRPCAACATPASRSLVGTCPDLGHRQADRPAAQAGRSRVVAPAGRRADDRGGRGGRPHRLARRRSWARSSTAAPALLFGPDRFHPSAEATASLVEAAAPLDAGRARPRPRGRGRARGLPRRGRAAGRRPRPSRPSSTPGTELDGTEVAGAELGGGGRWVTLMRRRRQNTTVEAPGSAPAAEVDGSQVGGR